MRTPPLRSFQVSILRWPHEYTTPFKAPIRPNLQEECDMSPFYCQNKAFRRKDKVFLYMLAVTDTERAQRNSRPRGREKKKFRVGLTIN